MSCKALVIKGANFTTNKLTTVQIGDIVPCTAISLDHETISFSSIGATQQLSATLTPNNTTDLVEWSSSNENCATVSDGLVTCVGVGSATITAICGTQSATCAVSSAVTIDANAVFTAENGYSVGGTDLSNSKDYIANYSSSKSRSYLSSTPTVTGYQAISSASTITSPWDALYPIMIPKGTSKITISAPSGLKNHVNISLLDSTSQPTYSISNKGVKAVYNSVDIKSTMELSLEEYTGYDSFVFMLQTTGADASSITGDVTVTYT